jgi:hypothetical protein
VQYHEQPAEYWAAVSETALASVSEFPSVSASAMASE